ncbi:MAG TPA: sensor histidine kinase, partial [Gammaproteobacteria bacterium]|nr:sensor histidine kinase [Gammaproteobacteria bacterium]
AQKLRVVLDNLLSNAIKYSPEGGHIRIVLIRRSGQVVLEVQDAGPGIDPDEHDKVFEPFYQGRAVYRGHIKGTGLGLAIAQEYIKAHGGKIAIIDQKHGACFRVTLPGAGPPIAMGQGSSPG